MKKLGPFLWICLAFFSFLTIGLISKGRDDFFLLLNGINHPVLDPIMMGFTHLGDGLGAISIIFIIFLFINRRWGTIIGLTSLANAVITQSLKRFVFNDIRRPGGHFDIDLLHQVEWVTIHQSYSFPSGHTSAAFCLYFCVAAMRAKNIYWQIGMGLLACIIAYSRIYVSNHFPTDVLAGGIMGLTIAIVGLAMFEKFQWGINWKRKGVLLK